jgi:hypothetical protein
MMIEFIISLEHNPAVTGAAHFIQAQNVLVEVKSFVQIQHTKLNKTRANGTVNSHNFPPENNVLYICLHPRDNHITSGLNTTQKGNALFQIGFINMGGAHGFKGGPISGNYLHPAYTAASAAAAVFNRPASGMNHRQKYRFIFGTGKTLSRILHRNFVFFHTSLRL